MSHVTLSQACETGVTSDINVTDVTRATQPNERTGACRPVLFVFGLVRKIICWLAFGNPTLLRLGNVSYFRDGVHPCLFVRLGEMLHYSANFSIRSRAQTES